METEHTHIDSISDDEFYEVDPEFSSMPDTTSSTPYKQRTYNVSRDASSVDQLKSGLEGDLDGRTLAQLELGDFVQYFMKCDRAVIDKIIALDWALECAEVAEIEKAITEGTEAQLHEPFMKITQSLLQRVIAVLGFPQPGKHGAAFSVPDDDKPHIVHIDGQDVDLSKIFHDTQGSTQYRYWGTHVKPDFLCHRPMPEGEDGNLSQATPIGKRALTLATRVGEFKKNIKGEPHSKKTKTATAASLASIIEEKKEPNTPNPLPEPEALFSPPSTTSGTTLFSADLPSTARSLRSVDPVFPSRTADTSVSKRKRGDFDDEDDEETAEEIAHQMLLAEVAATADVSQDHRQLGVYAMACLSTGARVYTTGIFVDGFQITMFYYDRRLVARSLSFDFRDQPQYLALLVYAMLSSDYRNDGLNIFLHKKSCTDNTCKGCVGSSMKDACFRFPFDTSTKIPGQDKPLETPSLPEDVSQLFAVFNVGELIHEAIGIVGRATVVRRVNPNDVPGVKKKDLRPSAALKMSWQPPYRCVEMNIIARLLERAPDCKPYLPEILYGGVFSAEALGLPSAMDVIPTDKLPEFVQRALHVVVSRLYHKIWTVKTIPEFLKIWFDCVKCHRMAWTDAGVLHRDLSENNLMFALKRVKKDNTREVDGIVNDWDMACTLNDEGNFEVSTATHRTGTLPFMSPDLLVPTPPRHYYRHDLESFVWILLNAMVRYDLPNGIRRPLPKALRNWEGPTTESAREFKDYALGSAGLNGLRKHVLEDWNSSFETLGSGLLRLVAHAHLTKYFAEELTPEAPFNYETCNGFLTYEKFIAVVSPHIPTSSA